MKPLALGLVLGALAIAPSVARADDDPDRRAFAAGLACFDDKRYPCAIDAWEGLVERVGTARAWKVLYNLGIAHDEMGDATRALDRWEAFLEAAPASEAAEQRADAQRRIAALRARFGEVVVPPLAAATARVGAGRDRAAGFRVLVAPGHHQVVLMPPGRPATTVELDVAAGDRKVLTWPPAAESSPSPPPPPPPPPPAPARGEPSVLPTALAITFGAATAASLALPIGLGVAAGATKDDAAEAKTREQYERAAGDFEDEKTIYTVSYAVPAVLGAATIGFVIWAISQAGDEGEAAGSAIIGPRSFGARF